MYLPGKNLFFKDASLLKPVRKLLDLLFHLEATSEVFFFKTVLLKYSETF